MDGAEIKSTNHYNTRGGRREAAADATCCSSPTTTTHAAAAAKRRTPPPAAHHQPQPHAAAAAKRRTPPPASHHQPQPHAAAAAKRRTPPPARAASRPPSFFFSFRSRAICRRQLIVRFRVRVLRFVGFARYSYLRVFRFLLFRFFRVPRIVKLSAATPRTLEEKPWLATAYAQFALCVRNARRVAEKSGGRAAVVAVAVGRFLAGNSRLLICVVPRVVVAGRLSPRGNCCCPVFNYLLCTFNTLLFAYAFSLADLPRLPWTVSLASLALNPAKSAGIFFRDRA